MSSRPYLSYLVVSAPSAGVLNVCEVKNVPLLVQSEERIHEMRSFDGGSLPPSVYLGRYWHHSRDKMDQAFPLRFCTLQAIKNWTVERPENEASPFLASFPGSSFLAGRAWE